jgi:hypothetical protein
MSDKLKKLANGNNSFAFPDSVRSPSPPPPIPIPYPNVGQASPLPPTVKHHLEARFGADLKDVKVYENHAATLLGAKALTSGNDIFLAPGAFNVSAEGQRLLGHEAAHVIQQRQGVVNEVVQAAIDDNSAADAND